MQRSVSLGKEAGSNEEGSNPDLDKPRRKEGGKKKSTDQHEARSKKTKNCREDLEEGTRSDRMNPKRQRPVAGSWKVRMSYGDRRCLVSGKEAVN